jgi:hypothetical protein
MNKGPVGDTTAIMFSRGEYERCLDPSKYARPS